MKKKIMMQQSKLNEKLKIRVERRVAQNHEGDDLSSNEDDYESSEEDAKDKKPMSKKKAKYNRRLKREIG